MSLSLTLLLFILVSTVSVTSTLRNLSPAAENKGVWCVANNKATDEQLQANIDWCCSYEGGFRDCTPINPGGVCYEPNTLRDHASYVMNLYYQNLGSTKDQCTFNGTGTQIGFAATKEDSVTVERSIPVDLALNQTR
ncbi:unnamed protein product [Arabidopsis lyrata]|nr:unnamed protein product [Arabidopsis lyrata]